MKIYHFDTEYGFTTVYSKTDLHGDDLKTALGPVALALGFFDGIHLGHQRLLSECESLATRTDARSGLLSFDRHPLMEIFPRYAPFLLMTNEEKAEKALEFGMDYVIFLPFSNKLRKLSPDDFIFSLLLSVFDLRGVVCGFNYSFGYKGKGNAEELKRVLAKKNIPVIISPALNSEGRTVSSTVIRELLETGDVQSAQELLGRAYALNGTIQQGKHLGRQYKIPTANLKTDTLKIMPKSGVYFTRITVDGKSYDGLTNLGHNPTFKDHPYSIETYIYDFNEDIYGKPVKLEFLKRIRSDMKFDSVDALFKQIHSDIIKCNMLYRNP